MMDEAQLSTLSAAGRLPWHLPRLIHLSNCNKPERTKTLDRGWPDRGQHQRLLAQFPCRNKEEDEEEEVDSTAYRLSSRRQTDTPSLMDVARLQTKQLNKTAIYKLGKNDSFY